MEERPVGKESSESVTSLVERGLGLITPNTEVLVLMFCGLIGTVIEVAGYWPTIRITDLFPESAEVNEGEQVQPQSQLNILIYTISAIVDLTRLYSVHIYLATYLLLPYPAITEKQRVLLTPWLLCAVLRSILLSLLEILAGIVLCAAQQKVHNQCLQYSIYRGAEFSTSLFFWTSIHNFYYYLENKKSNHEFDKVLKTIHKAKLRHLKSESTSSFQTFRLLSDDKLSTNDDEEPESEATLVERAAMAWIAREILEDDGEYETDKQFSNYLAFKATMELREIMKELAEKKRSLNIKDASMQERIKDSLEFCKKTSKHYESFNENTPSKLEAFDQSVTLSRRDPIRRIPPLTVQGKPFSEDDDSVDDGPVSVREQWKVFSDSNVSKGSEASVEVQTDPLSPQMNQLFDQLDQQYAKQEMINSKTHR